MKVGILSFSDGRPRVHETLAQGISDHANRIVEILTNEAVDIEIVTGDRIIYTPAIAREEAFRLVSAGVDAVIFNIPVFAFPYLSVIAAQLLQKPILILTPEDGSLPGLGGMLASAGGLRQIGIRPERVWGSIGDPKVKERVLRFLRAASVVNRLRGQVYGWFGGRSIGMGTTTPDFDRWYRIFGVDVEHIGEIEIIRRAQAMPDEVVTEGLEWLENNCREVAYDGDALTRDTLAFQLKCYLATEELVRERCLDFIGVKCHYDLSEHYVTQCVSCALCNDPYDWRGQKDTTVFSCEGDSDGALTMQILKLLTGQPTLLTDLRHYDRNTGLYVFCNCGAHATWFAHNSADPKENLKDIALYPTIPKYKAGGAHVQSLAKPGQVTFARLSRSEAGYEMAIFAGELVSVPIEKLKETCWEWPHAYARIPISPERLFENYHANHAHFVYGDWQSDLVKVCELLGITANVIE